MRRYAFATVAFEGDLELMDRQARSMGLYADPDLIDEILIIDNFADGARPAGWCERTRDLYGPIADKVSFVPGREVCDLGQARGWVTQQALKLAISRLINVDRFVILDAKTYATRPLTRDFFEKPDGIARINGYAYDRHPLLDRLQNTRAYMGLPPIEPGRRFVRTSPPFVMHTQIARHLAKFIEAESAGSIADEMQRANVTEFFLYGSLLETCGVLESVYAWDQPFTPDLWEWSGKQDDLVAEAIAKANDPARFGPFMTVHRGALAVMSDTGKAMLEAFWRERGLT
jgi:hypothetical protein